MRGRQRKNRQWVEPRDAIEDSGRVLQDLRLSVAVQLAQEITRLGWDQVQAARHLGVTQQRLSHIVTGKCSRFTLDTVAQMLCALGLEVRFACCDEGSDYSVVEMCDAEAMVAYCTRQLGFFGTSLRWRLKRARAYEQLGRYHQALDDYHMCILFQPDQPVLREARAALYLSTNHLGAALRECDTLLQLFPSYDCYATRGRVLTRLCRRAEAIADFDRAVARRPDEPGGYWGRAQVYSATRNWEAAVSDYEQVVRLDPTNREARRDLRRARRCLLQLGATELKLAG